MEEQPDKLTPIYDDPSWLQEQRIQRITQFRRYVWKVAGVLAVAVIILFLAGWFKNQYRLEEVMWGFVVLVAILLIIQFIASILSVFCAVIPVKNYDYTERLEVWIPVWTVIIEGLVILLFVLGYLFGI
jgi:uncharacterized membrane protein YcjF (UPF0283 family)